MLRLPKLEISNQTIDYRAVNEPKPGESLPPAPPIAHFIWEGKTISADNIANIIEFITNYPNFSVVLWTTKSSLFYNAQGVRGRHRNKSQENNPLNRIKIKNPFELFDDMINAVVGNNIRAGSLTTGEIYKLSAIYKRELFGCYNNYAAASDILRLLVLYVYGGIYLDVDVRVRPNAITPCSWSVGKAGFGMVTYARNRFLNGFLFAVPESPFIKKLLSMIVNEYTAPENSDIAWHTKRAYALPQCSSPLDPRLVHTMAFTGPSMLANATQKFFNITIDDFPALVIGKVVNRSDIGNRGKYTFNDLRLEIKQPAWIDGFNAEGRWMKPNEIRVRRNSG